MHKQTVVPGVNIIEPTTHADERGYFCESFNTNKFKYLELLVT